MKKYNYTKEEKQQIIEARKGPAKRLIAPCWKNS